MGSLTAITAGIAPLVVHQFCDVTHAAETDHCKDRTDIGDASLVKNGDDAMRIAFAMWHAVNPRFNAEDERAWSEGFTATLDKCVWQVSAKPEPPRTYSTFTINIGAQDGRFLGAEISD